MRPIVLPKMEEAPIAGEQLAGGFTPQQQAKYVPYRVGEALLERPAWSVTSALARIGKKVAEFTPAIGEVNQALKEKTIGWLDKTVDYYSQPEKYGFVTPYATEFRTRKSQAAYNQSLMSGVTDDLIEATTDISALFLHMGMIKGAVSAPTLQAKTPLQEIYAHLKRIGTYGFFTREGTLTERAKTATRFIAYNVTPYLANATGAVGMTAVGVDTMLNSFITSPTYIQAFKEAGGVNEEFMRVAIPQFVMDVAFAWRTRGLPKNQYRTALSRYYKARLKDFKLPKVEFDRLVKDFQGTLTTEAGFARIGKEPIKKGVMIRLKSGETGRVLSIKGNTVKYMSEAEIPMSTVKSAIVEVLPKVKVPKVEPEVPKVPEPKYVRFGRKKFERELRKAKTTEELDTIAERYEPFREDLKYTEQVAELSDIKEEMAEKLAPKAEAPKLETPEERTERISGVKFIEKIEKLPTRKVRPREDRLETERLREKVREEKARVKEYQTYIKSHLQTGEVVEQKATSLATNIKGKGWLVKFRKAKAGEIYHYGATRSARLFEKLDGYERGENMQFFYDRVNEARSNNLRDYNAELDRTIRAIQDNGVNLTDWYIPQKINDKLSLTSDQKVELYLALRDADKSRHLLQQGFIDDDGNIIGLTTKDVRDMIASMKPEEIRIADYFAKWYVGRHPGVGEVYANLTGKVFGKVSNYGGMIRVDRDTINFEEDLIGEVALRGERVPEPGFMKTRQELSAKPLKIGMLENYLYYLGRSSHYIHFGPILQDMGRVLKNPTYRQSVVNSRGMPFYKELLKWYDDIKRYSAQKEVGQITKALRIVRRNAAVSVLGFNLLPGGRQLLSTFNAIAEVESPSAIMSGWRQVATDYKTVKDFVWQRSPQVRYRFVERDIEEMIRGKGVKAIFGRRARLSEKAMFFIRANDRATVLSVWKGAYDLEMRRSGDEARAIRFAEDTVRKTQPMADIKDLPAFFKGGELEKMFTMFQNQINNNYNYWTHDIIGKTIAGKLTPRQVALRVTWSYLIPAFVMGMINRGGLPDDLNDVAIDMVTYPVAGLIFIGNIINSILRGYEQAFPLPFQQLGAMYRALRAEDWQDKLNYGARSIARLMGIPYSQAERTIKGVRDLWEGYSDDWRRLIWSEWSLEQPRQREIIPEELNIYFEDLFPDRKRPIILPKLPESRNPIILPKMEEAVR